MKSRKGVVHVNPLNIHVPKNTLLWSGPGRGPNSRAARPGQQGSCLTLEGLLVRRNQELQCSGLYNHAN